jgi:hypothetical protein
MGTLFPNYSIIFLIMSTQLLALAADLADTNSAGSQLVVSIVNAETGADLVEALDAYDNAQTPVAV